jgi:predicted XRE-type DNA-binding protein
MKSERYASVWDAIADSPEEAANLRARAELMEKLEAIVTESGWTQTEAAARYGGDPAAHERSPARGVSRFSLHALVNIATALGRRVRVEMDAA